MYWTEGGGGYGPELGQGCPVDHTDCSWPRPDQGLAVSPGLPKVQAVVCN